MNRSIVEMIEEIEKSDEQKYFDLWQEGKAQIKDIESALIDALISEKTHKERDIDLKRIILEIRQIRRNKERTIDIIPF